MPFEALYHNLILDHYKNPRNYGKLDGATVRMRHENPSCGDQIELHLALGTESKIVEIKFEGYGCALSRASASMMTVAVRNQTSTQARERIAAFRALFMTPRVNDESLGDLQAFAGVSEFPARIACALLPWNALTEYLNERQCL
ncbi:MAG: Fe-S cluster assembly sulfur transfer protein SufU [candidate division KSB1 bacterium]